MPRMLVTVFIAIALGASGIANAKVGSDDEFAPTIRLTGDEVTLPIVMVHEFPFVEAEVNGVRGNLMFDTGTGPALILNDHRIPLKGGTKIGSGNFASGQTFTMRRNEKIASVKFARFSYIDVRNVMSQDARQLEAITPDFLGWIGFEFFRGYAIKIDYRRKKLTFYKDGPTAATHFLQGEKVVAVIPFEQRKLARTPVVQVTLDSTIFEGTFDTGAYGGIRTDNATRNKLATDGILTTAKDAAGKKRVDLIGVDIGNGAADLALRFDVGPEPNPSAKPQSIRPNNNLKFAFNLLSRYKAVWDYSDHKIYLLEYDGG